MRFTDSRRLSFPVSLSMCSLPAILLAGALAGCSGGGGGSAPDAAPPDAVPPPSLAEVQDLFNRECGGGICHVDHFSAGGDLDLNPAATCGELVNIAAEEVPTLTLLVPGNPAASYLVCKSDPACPDLPEGADLMPIPDGLTPTDLDLLSRWVAAGAPGCPTTTAR